jgi:ubiquinol-cytochrome c reductase cytochrome c1 subunit
MIKRASISLLATVAISMASAATVRAQHGAALDEAGNDVADTASLQRGAKYFVNYCLGCHSADYVRYSRLAEDLQISEQLLVDTLMFTGEQPFDTMSIAMKPEDAMRWFGVAPPDLSLIARSRGTDYLYTFLRSFYVDESRPTGVDNLVLPGTAMPHVLWELQGLQAAVFELASDGFEHFEGFESLSSGKLNPQEYDSVIRDIVNFLDYIGEPMQLERQRLGTRVIAFLLLLLLLSYLLKKEIWKDVE